MRRRGWHLAVVAAAVVLMGIGPGGCHKLDHRTGPQKLDQAMSKAFKRAYAAYYRMTTGRPRSRIVRSAKTACHPREPAPHSDRGWKWFCAIQWIRRDRTTGGTATYGVEVDPRGCFQASSASFPPRAYELVLHRPAPNPLDHIRSCP